MTRSIQISIAVAAATLFWSAGCDSGNGDSPPMQPVPVSERSAPVAGNNVPSGAPPSGLPADHPPIPGAEPSGSPSGLPADHPPLPSGQSPSGLPPMPGGAQPPPFLAGPRLDAGGLRWSAPDGWIEQPPASSMRLTQWQVGASQPAGPAECALLRFQGGGSVQENLVRWIGQFSQPDGSSTADHAQQFQATVNGLTITRLELTGTYNASMGPMMGGPTAELPDHALFAVVVESSEGMYFLKCTGPAATVAAEHAGMMSIVGSLSME